MSNKEESLKTVKSDCPLEPSLEGACGGGEEDLVSGMPCIESDDNLSMEVRFSEGSSHHASDLSSVSYQNLLDDDATGAALSHHDSDDSVDSYINMHNCDDIQRPSDLNIQDTVSYSDKLSKRLSIQLAEDGIPNQKKSCSLMQSTISVKSEPGPDTLEERDFLLKQMKSNLHPLVNVADSFRKHDLFLAPRDQQRCKSLPPKDDKDVEKKRNSLEIRNNIPVSGEVKNYDKDIQIDNISIGNQGAKPKIKKQSPGLACRVEENDNSSSKKVSNMENNYLNTNTKFDQSGLNMDDDATKIINELIQVSKVNTAALSDVSKKSHLDEVDIKDEHNKKYEHSASVVKGVALPGSQTADILNEYEYVKYSRIHEGNSYVGMRLAFSSTESDSQCHKSIDGAEDLRESHRSNSVDLDVFKSDLSPDSNLCQGTMFEDLEEIPLNGPDAKLVGEDGKLFTLSPEYTECDSAEIESVVSDGEDSATGMPNVEDGLSSSQASDTDDVNRSEHNTPKKMLQKRQQQEVERKMFGVECPAMKPKEMDACAIIDDLKMKRVEVDNAISEIKCALQKNKKASLEAPFKVEVDEMIWVKRDEQPSAPKGRFTHDGMNGKEIELRSDTGQRKLGNSKGYINENDYDDDGIHYTRRNNGKKYSQLAKDDSEETPSHDHFIEGDSSQLRVDSVSMYSDANSYTFAQDSHSDKQNSESMGSSEDLCSDSEISSKQGYIHSRKEGDFDTDEETDHLLEKQYQGSQYVDIPELSQPPTNRSLVAEKRKSRAKEVQINDPENPSVLIEGVLFRAHYLGSTQLISEGQPSKAMRMMQAQEAVGRIKAPEGENQPSTEVDLFVSTEKIMVLNTDLQEIMMDHSLRTISYIADIGDILVIMARRRLLGSPGDTESMRRRKQAKIICHVFESEEPMFSIGGNLHLSSYKDTKYEPFDLILEAQDEAQLIAQSIGQAFQVAYIEFLKANGIEDTGMMKEIDYQEVLNQQQIYGEELLMFSNKENQKEVIIPKVKGEQLGVVIVESGWGSMVPTVVLANMAPTGPAARCGLLNIGDQIISVNGISLVGLPLSSCQTNIKGTKHQTVVKLTVVPCPPVVEVLIKRPDVKYQLGFSVQNGVICSLLRGGIAERGGVRVGHRIIEINSQSVVAVAHEKIVSLLANSVGEIQMKTMPTSIFRLLTGQETPHYL